MLYDCWRGIAAAFADRLALLDLNGPRRWTFRELAAVIEREPRPAARRAFPCGNTAEFILATLRAWRFGQVACPLEPGQPRPRLAGHLPAGVVHLKTTSATGGKSRFIAFTGDQLAADAANIVQTMGLRADWPNVGVISLAHSYGFSNLALPLLLHGIPLVIARGPLPEALREAAATQREVTLPAVPALWRAWHEARAIPINTRLAISAGAPLPLTLEQAIFRESGLKVHNFYGSSECGGIAYDRAEKPRDEETRAGEPMANVQVTIAEDGCVEARGAAVGLGYWPRAHPALRAGVFRTTDLGALDSRGLQLKGRLGDLVNVAGRKVAPETIERALARHPAVRACLVFGIPDQDARRGEVVVACVVRRSGAEAGELRRFAIQHLPDWQAPRHWWFVESLEPDGRGKLSRAGWRREYLRAGAAARDSD